MKKIIVSIVNVVSTVTSNFFSFIFGFLHPIRVRRIKKRLRDRVKKGENIRVLFIIQFPEMWNSLKGVYEELSKRINFETTILAVPKREQSNFFKTTFASYNAAYLFFEANEILTINAYSSGKWLKIKNNEYDYIFLQRPYDTFMPKELSMSVLSSKALLCYIPYGFQFVNGKHLDIEYNSSAVNNLFLIYADNEDSYNYCIRVFRKFLEKQSTIVVNEGYPRFDFIEKSNIEQKHKKVFLWLPRWSLDSANDKSGFFDYYDKFMQLFETEEYDNCKLIIRPHPLMFSNFLERGILSQVRYEEIINQIETSERVYLDKNPDYLESFVLSDAMIADFTSLMIEYFVTGKPIVYCGDNSQFNSVGKLMDQCLYKADTWEQIEKCLNNIKTEDYLMQDRLLTISKVLCHEYPVSKHFVEVLEKITKDEYRY